MKQFMLLSLLLCLFVKVDAAGTPGLNYNYYEGLWSTLPNFSNLTPVKKGITLNVTLDPRNKDMQYAFQWTGYISIPAAGTYTFGTYSDDGSSLYIGSTLVVNNDGVHASQFATGNIALNAGAYPITIAYFQGSGGQSMQTYWSSNSGISLQLIPNSVLTIDNPAASTTSIDLRGINNYYFSAIAGDDSRTAAQAMNPTTPWKTLQKLKSISSSLKPGDAVLFNRGETFTGSMVLSASGTAGAPIIFSAYGTGSRPVINGLAMLKTWTNVGNGAWETSLSGGSYLNLVLVNELVQPMGRFPNSTLPGKGFLTIDAHSGTSSITDNELGSSANWTGAEIVVRKNDRTIDRAAITAQSGNTLSFISPAGHEPTDGYGYFIQNSPLTLDQPGEWYYNPSTKKLRMYFGAANPGAYSIKASIADTLVTVNGKNYITFDNMCFRGADVAAFQLNDASNITIQNSEINYTGVDGISGANAPYVSIEKNLINHSNNSGIRLYDGSSYASIRNNAIRNSGTMPGMGCSNNQQYDGIFLDAGPSGLIELNTVDSSGYCGITFTGDYTTVRNNVVNTFCMTVNDGGGIYTWGGWDKVGRTVTGNIVLNGIGAPAGTNSTIPCGAVGIYTDDMSSHIDITNNSVANCVRAGIFLHNSHEINVTGNTLYNNAKQLSMIHDPAFPDHPIRNVVTSDNIMSASKFSDVLVENISHLTDIGTFGTYNNNHYVRPTDENGIFTTSDLDNGYVRTRFFDLAAWTADYGFDKQSTKSPFTIPEYTVNSLIGDEKCANGSFNNSIDGAFCISSPGHATASLSSGKLDGGTLQVYFDGSNGATNTVGAYIDFGEVTAGKTYLITFSLIGAATSRTIQTFVLENGGSYGRLSDFRYFNASTSRTENQFLFTAPTTISNATLAFVFAGTDCPIWFDNVHVHEANVTAINTDDYMRFVYNETATTKKITLSGNYVDALNRQYQGSVNLAPFSSLVLIKKTAVTASQATTQSSAGMVAVAESLPMDATGMISKIIPNPARERIVVKLNIPSNTLQASLSIYSLSGINLKTMVLANTATSVPVDVTDFTNGIYIVKVVCDGRVTASKFVKQ